MLGGGRIELGDGNDTASLDTGDLSTPDLRGGPGNDTLLGDADRATVFAGGDGNDRMVGGTGGDIFDEGSRANGSDTIVGRGGEDSVSYDDRRGAVRVSLDGRRNDGRREGDLVGTDVENVVGGRGRDRLRGNGAANTLSGGRGADSIRGGGGDDELHAHSQFGIGRARTKDRLAGGSGNDSIDGSRGRNVLSGGSGNDVITGSGGADRIRPGRGRDRVSAGAGDDRVASADRTTDRINCGSGDDRLSADRRDRRRRCERVTLRP